MGFEPTSANTVELESTPLDRSGTLTIRDLPTTNHNSTNAHKTTTTPSLKYDNTHKPLDTTRMGEGETPSRHQGAGLVGSIGVVVICVE